MLNKALLENVRLACAARKLIRAAEHLSLACITALYVAADASELLQDRAIAVAHMSGRNPRETRQRVSI